MVELPIVPGGFHTILADCPWPSASHKGKRTKWISQNMRPRYHTMTAKQILDLPVSQIAAQDAVLVLWATWMHLNLAMKVIDKWDFTYCAGMPWLKVCREDLVPPDMRPNSRTIMKPIFGPGVWFQGCTELILIARRGHPFGKLGNPRPARKGVIVSQRGEHSEKPSELQDWIDANFPGPKLEMFARKQRAGWTCCGDEL